MKFTKNQKTNIKEYYTCIFIQFQSEERGMKN